MKQSWFTLAITFMVLSTLSMQCGRRTMHLIHYGQVQIMPSPVIGHQDSVRFYIDIRIVKPRWMHNKQVELNFYLSEDHQSQKLSTVLIPPKVNRKDTLFEERVLVDGPIEIDLQETAYVEVQAIFTKVKNGASQKSERLGIAEVYRDSLVLQKYLKSNSN